jgi:hypothetical protein
MLTWQLLKEESMNKNWKNSSKFKYVHIKIATLGHVSVVNFGFIHLQPGTSKPNSKASAFQGSQARSNS